VKYGFGAYTVDIDRVELRHGAEPVSVEPQVFDIIVYLIQHGDRVVSGDELLDTIWKGRSVSLSTLTTRINAARRAIGDNGTEQKLIKTIHRKGYRFVGTLDDDSAGDAATSGGNHHEVQMTANSEQEVMFCMSGNNVHIAYSKTGRGPPLVRVGNWCSRLEYDWDSPVWGYMLKWLASDHELVRYDMRGIGLSDNDVQEFSFDAFVRDLEAVTKAAGIDKFVLFGFSDGAAISVAYATRFPERVSKLILFAGYGLGPKRRGMAMDSAKADAAMSMLQPGLGPDNTVLQFLFTSQFAPTGTAEQKQWLLDLLAKSGNNALRKLEVTSEIDITDLLPKVSIPTLVMHCRNDPLHPFEQGRLLAANIPGAKFMALEGYNHALLEQDEDWPKFQREFKTFLAA
jgi:pimeloyl-ACP methyl ester carboxylesterase/DNA-binding winged helix-turn-helix (wHTH) protein